MFGSAYLFYFAMFYIYYYIYTIVYIYFLRMMINIVSICVLRSHVQPAKNTPLIMNNTSPKLGGLLTCFGRLLHRSPVRQSPFFSRLSTPLALVQRWTSSCIYSNYILYNVYTTPPYITLIDTRMICAISSHYLRFVGGSQWVIFAEKLLQWWNPSNSIIEKHEQILQ